MAKKEQYSTHRYTLNDLRRAQTSDVVLCCLQQLVQSQDPNTEELLGAAELLTTARSYFARFRGMIKLDKHGILVRSHIPTERVLADTPLVILPQLFHMEVMLAAHDRQGHQGHHRVTTHISKLSMTGLPYMTQ